MKKSELKKIIKEEVDRHIMMEGLIDSIIMMFLSPKIKKEVDVLKKSPDWKELIQKINTTRDEMEMWNSRFEKYLAQCKKEVAAAKKMGIKVKDCSDLEKWKRDI
jgi:hypothetical protein